IATKVFNVGNYRRKLHGAHQLHNFFDPHNPEGERSRREAATEALNDMIRWFNKDHGVVALYDATNSTRSRREMLLSACRKHSIQVMFIESICQDEALVLYNIMDVKLSSPDYKDMDPDQAAADFRARIVHYEEAYETITEDNLTYIKLINVGSQVIINHIQGYLQSRIVYYLMNLHIAPRSIFFSRHGESLYNVMGKLGGDSDLSARGKQYAKSLPLLIATHLGNSGELTVWTSTMRRTIQTAQHLTYPKLAWKALDELDAGVCDGMTYEEIEEQYPEDFANRDEDKFNYRYRGGESYRDVVVRLEPVIMDLERQRNILIIGHQAILRCIYAYFMNHSHEKLPYIKIPLHTLIQLTPKAYTCEEKRFKVDIEAVDTHRPKPRAGAPKTEAGQPLDHIPTEAEANTGKDAAITTTTMSTTTFRDSPYSTLHKTGSSSSRSDKGKALDASTKSISEAFEDKTRAVQAALIEGMTTTTSDANPAMLSPLQDTKTPGQVQAASASPSLNPIPPQVHEKLEEDHQIKIIPEGLDCHKVTRGFDAQGAPPEGRPAPAPGLPSSSSQPQTGEKPSGFGSKSGNNSFANHSSNLTISTSNKSTSQNPIASSSSASTSSSSSNTLPLLSSVKHDSIPSISSWQDGPEYERTAGASPRDPVMSPGGRLLPKKKENWHFPE
ncbi:Fructose-2,6-bisphosphatase, partial [Podila humilis]